MTSLVEFRLSSKRTSVPALCTTTGDKLTLRALEAVSACPESSFDALDFLFLGGLCLPT